MFAIDGSSSKTGLCLGRANKLEVIKTGLLIHATREKIGNRYVRAYFNILQLEKGLDENVDFAKVKGVILEATSMPSYTGRVLTLYLGLYLHSILKRVYKGTIIKIVHPLDGQRHVFGSQFMSQKKPNKMIKEISIATAKKLFPEAIISSDDISDAILMYTSFKFLPTGNL